MVDVVVTDKKGQPITGLKADDFTIEESGKKQKVSVFVAPGAAVQSTPTPAPPGVLSNHPENLEPAGIPTVLLLDAANSRFQDQAYGRSQMLKYVSEQAESGKPMAVVTLTNELHVLQEFTTDPKLLATAIKNLRPQEKILLPGPPPAPITSPSDSGLRAGAATLGATIQAEVAGFENAQVGYELERRTLITVQALRDLSRMLSGFSGRKNVVWLTAEFPFDLIPEDRNISDQELMGDLPSVRQKSVTTNASSSLLAQQRELHGQ